MESEIRTVCYDRDLHIEAYRIKGTVQPFPNHFHNYYVIGLTESGMRRMCCKNVKYNITAGDILLFNPGDSHSCDSIGGEPFDYKAVNISNETMLSIYREITGQNNGAVFCENLIHNDEMSSTFRILHKMITENADRFEKEEQLLIFMSLLMENHSRPLYENTPVCKDEIESVCGFINENYSGHITLKQLCSCSGLSSSSLLRAFTASKGVTPYRYLQSVRIDRAKVLLEQGMPPADAAIQTGFSDQSHFTNYFNMFIGLSPAAYRRIFRKGSS